MGGSVVAENPDLPMPMKQLSKAPMWVLMCSSQECRIAVYRPVSLNHTMLHASAATH